MFKCFGRCYMKVNLQINNISFHRSIMCSMTPNANLFTNYFKRIFVEFKKYSLDKATKIDERHCCFVKSKIFKSYKSFFYLCGQAQPQTYFSFQDYSDKKYKSFLVYLVSFSHRPIESKEH